MLIQITATLSVLHLAVISCKWREKTSEFLQGKASSDDTVAMVFRHIESSIESLQYPEYFQSCSNDSAAEQKRLVYELTTFN